MSVWTILGFLGPNPPLFSPRYQWYWCLGKRLRYQVLGSHYCMEECFIVMCLSCFMLVLVSILFEFLVSFGTKCIVHFVLHFEGKLSTSILCWFVFRPFIVLLIMWLKVLCLFEQLCIWIFFFGKILLQSIVVDALLSIVVKLGMTRPVA